MSELLDDNSEIIDCRLVIPNSKHLASIIIETTDWNQLVPKLQYYAYCRMGRYRWRGTPPGTKWQGLAIADGKSAEDFVNDALEALLKDVRTWNREKSVECNLKGIIRSLVFNHKQKSDRKPLIEPKAITNVDGDRMDITLIVADPNSTDAEKNERIVAQKQFLEDFTASIANDKELSLLLDAYQRDITKNSEIEKETGLLATRVSELKRKLATRLLKFKAQYPETEKAALATEL